MVLDVEGTSLLGAAHRFYEDVRAIQLVYADPQGRFPWQEGTASPPMSNRCSLVPGNR